MENTFDMNRLREKAALLAATLKEKGLTLATAESCTGGLVGALLTSLPGISSVYRGGVISYANEVKASLLGVKNSTLQTVGAVSAVCAEEMVRGVLTATDADLGVSVTGIAGPDGGTPQKPLGLVYIAVGNRHTSVVSEIVFSGSREEVRLQAVNKALSLLLELAGKTDKKALL